MSPLWRRLDSAESGPQIDSTAFYGFRLLPGQIDSPPMSMPGSGAPDFARREPRLLPEDRIMTLQNRVTPFGEIAALAERGLFMGNRGRLHDGQKRLTKRRYTTLAWIVCVLSFRGRQREVMTPNRYTELFFLDEATGFAAGHRPCAECRREDFNRFKALWLEANGMDEIEWGGGHVPVARIDAVLHQERMAPLASGTARPEQPLKSLPDGAMITLDDPHQAWLVRGASLFPWTSGGYGEPVARLHSGMSNGMVRVLTPLSTVRAMIAGYEPRLHPSAMER